MYRVSVLYSIHMDGDRWHQIEQLYDAAVARGPAERAAFLDDACPDPAFRREIEEMIEETGGADVLGHPAGLPTLTMTHELGRDSVAPGATHIVPGQNIHQYRVLKKIGSGGMGDVFLAEDTILNRRVALKFLRTGGGVILAREILAEARSAAALDHPYTCKVFATGEFEGESFIAMEFVEGETLQQHLRSGPLPLQNALPILIEITEALAEAHGKNMIHCDIKPGNVMIARGGHVKLMDFGLAKRIRPPLFSSDDTVTISVVHRRVAGTPGYMAPEQVRGEPLDARADVFALGIVIFEMLTGVHPFRKNNTAATVGAILYQDAPSVSQYLPSASLLLTQILTRMLARDPSARYASAEELTADLVALRGQTSTASSLQTLPTIAILPFQDLSPQHDQDYFCDGLAEELILVLGRVDRLRVVSRSEAFQFRNATIGLNEIGKALRATMVLEGSVRKAGERIRIVVNLVDIENRSAVWSERYDRQMHDIFEIQDDIARATADKLRVTFRLPQAGLPNEICTCNVRAYDLYLKARHFWNQRTEENIRRSIDHFEKALAEDGDYAMAWSGLADAWLTLCLYGAVNPVEAMPLAKSAVERALKLKPELPEALKSRACVQAVSGWNWQEAERDFETAIRLNPRSAQAHQWFAINCLAPRGHFERAAEELKFASELEPVSLAIATSVGVLDFFRGETDAAIRRFRAVLELDENFYLAHYFLGQACSQKQLLDEAIRELERAANLSGGSAESLAALGYVQGFAGNWLESQRILRQLLQKEESGYVSPVLIAQVQIVLGQTEEAYENLEKALSIRATDVIWLNVRPAFSPIGSHRRFREILAAVGLETQSSGEDVLSREART